MCAERITIGSIDQCLTVNQFFLEMLAFFRFVFEVVSIIFSLAQIISTKIFTIEVVDLSLSMMMDFNFVEFSHKVDGVRTKYNSNESVCCKRSTMISPWPKIKLPRNMVKEAFKVFKKFSEGFYTFHMIYKNMEIKFWQNILNNQVNLTQNR